MQTPLERAARAALLAMIALPIMLSQRAGADAQPVPAALPGAEAFSAGLRGALAKALLGQGEHYEPRTRNLTETGAPRFTNRLMLERSPYLRQHAHNPVNWHAWGDEAFATARRLDRPLLVSIGYSTCHWCHVMEEESFDDPALAEYLNAHFIAIKVDREERPDVDSIYMAAVHALGERGGWPLNVFVTPEREPFYGGTYFPPEEVAGRGGRPSFRRVLDSIRETWDTDRARLVTSAAQVAAAIRSGLETTPGVSSTAPSAELLDRAVESILARADLEEGGRRGRIKFPSSLPLRFLLRYERRTDDERVRDLSTRTLEKMASGGIRDQLGGGFHRYSTDPRWLVPHFEKMLYDNALLASVYLEAWQATGRDDFAQVVRTTLDFVDRVLGLPEGGFASATDADSRSPEGELVEGWFFTWTPSELEAVLGEQRAKIAAEVYGVGPAGDVDGRSVLRRWKSLEEIAKALGLSRAKVEAELPRLRDELFAARGARPAPLRDDKVLAAWNGLAISAFAQAGFALEEPRYLARAERAAHFALEQMRPGGRLVRVWAHGEASGPAFLDDHTFLIAALIDLYETTGKAAYLREALALQQELDTRFADQAGGGYFATAKDHEALIVREKPRDDGVVPSGNSIAGMNLLRLAELTGDRAHAGTAEMLFGALGPLLRGSPGAFGDLLLTVERQLDEVKEVVLVAPREGHEEAFAALQRPLRRGYVPSRVSVVLREGAPLEESAPLVPLVAGKRALRGRPTAFVCKNRVCAHPTSDPKRLAEQLAVVAPLRAPAKEE